MAGRVRVGSRKPAFWTRYLNHMQFLNALHEYFILGSFSQLEFVLPHRTGANGGVLRWQMVFLGVIPANPGIHNPGYQFDCLFPIFGFDGLAF